MARTCGGERAPTSPFQHLTGFPLTTPDHYDLLLARCRALFLAKTHDYGTAWRILRLPSVTDQIFIKANRIRTIQETGVQLVADDV